MMIAMRMLSVCLSVRPSVVCTTRWCLCVINKVGRSDSYTPTHKHAVTDTTDDPTHALTTVWVGKGVVSRAIIECNTLQ